MRGVFGKSSKRTKVTCSDVADAYGAFLERVPYGVGLSLPTADLPYDIALIKEALTQLATLPEHSDRLAMLKAGFLELSAFSAGYVPSGLIDAGGKLPKSRAEMAQFFSEHGHELCADKDISYQIAAKREVLEGEWDLRMTLQQVSAAQRFSS